MVYISEAEKYDRALVESWKGDMEGLLIFVSLLHTDIPGFQPASPRLVYSPPF
jgi:hypothetical protein